MSNRKTTAEQIAAAKAKLAQKEARIKELLQKQKAEERKARNYRFCKRGGYMEKMFPELSTITDEQFEIFFNKTTANSFGRSKFNELFPKLTTAVHSDNKADKTVDTGKTPN